MKEFKLQTSIKLALFVFALTIALVVLWINTTIINNLREGNRQQLEKVARSYSQSISNSTDEELAFIINVLLPSLNFPIIITTQDEILSNRLDPIKAGQKLANYLNVLTLEAQTLARACGKSHIRNLEPEDLNALTVEASAMAKVPLAGTDWIPSGKKAED